MAGAGAGLVTVQVEVRLTVLRPHLAAALALRVLRGLQTAAHSLQQPRLEPAHHHHHRHPPCHGGLGSAGEGAV